MGNGATPAAATAGAADTSPEGIGEVSEYRNTAGVVKVGGDRARQFRRRGELARLVAWRRKWGVVDPATAQDWATVCADLAVYSRHGVDRLSVGEIARVVGVEIPDRIVMQAVYAIAAIEARKGRAYRPIGGETIARWLRVTADERSELRIRTIGAIDETREEREARLVVDRRKRDAERKRRARAAEGAKQQGTSDRRTQPWVEAGISRRTWYRRRKAGALGTISSTHNTERVSERTIRCHAPSDPIESPPSTQKARPPQKQAASGASPAERSEAREAPCAHVVVFVVGRGSL